MSKRESAGKMTARAITVAPVPLSDGPRGENEGIELGTEEEGTELDGIEVGIEEEG